MINLNSKHHECLLRELKTAAESKDCSSWVQLVKGVNSGAADPFLAISEYGIESELFDGSTDCRSISEWIGNIDRLLNKVESDPDFDDDTGSLLIYYSWRQFINSTIVLLRQAIASGSAPSRGGILAYMCGLSVCVVLGYESNETEPSLYVISVMNDPTSAFDYLVATEGASVDSRNKLKQFYATGHKIVVHRGVFLHLDRRVDKTVFGPSIDTLVMAEILVQTCFESSRETFATVLEVGCGNGLLTNSLASHCPGLVELFTLDISFEALACTERNYRTNRRPSVNGPGSTMTMLHGFFDPTLLNRKFDLIVCNPPYIPLPPEIGGSGSNIPDYYQSVGGTELLGEILSKAHNLLSPGGKLLIMTTNLCLEFALTQLSKQCIVSRPLGEEGMEVVFDVEAVFNRKEWLDFLVYECDLIARNGVYFHTLHPLWIELVETS